MPPAARAQSADVSRTATRKSHTGEGFMASTKSYDQHLHAQSSRKDIKKHHAAYEQVALEALWKGVKSTYGIDRNMSSNTNAALQWGTDTRFDPPKHATAAIDSPAPSRPQTAAYSRPRGPTPAIEGIPNKLETYPKHAQELAFQNHARGGIFGSTFQDLAAFPSASCTDNGPGHQLYPKKIRPASAAATSSSHAEQRAAARPFSAATARAAYQPVKVSRGSDGMPDKIGSFPPPTPLEPDAQVWFRDNSYTTAMSFYNSQGRMGPGQKPVTELGQHHADASPSHVRTASQQVLYENHLFRDPAMDDPLYSSFSGDKMFHDWTVARSPPLYRKKDSVPLPLPDGSYQDQSKLFLQSLDRHASSQKTKEDIRIKTSARTMEILKKKQADSLVYTTILQDEETKRRKFESAERQRLAKERQWRKLEQSHFHANSRFIKEHPEQQANPGQEFDLQAYLDGGARTPDGRGSGKRSSRSPDRTASPNNIERSLRATTAPRASGKGQRPQSAFIPTPSHDSIDSSASSNLSNAATASAAMRRTILALRADPGLLQAFATLSPQPITATG